MVTDDTITLRELKGSVRAFVEAREWQKYHSQRNLAASISIEAAELLELFQWSAEGEVMAIPDFEEKLADEMADILMYLCSLANIAHVDLAKAVSKKMLKNEKKYPVSEFKGRYYKPKHQSV